MTTSERIKRINDFKNEIFREYEYYYYVPMAEAYDIQIPVTVGCSYDKCLFCDLNGASKFHEIPLDKINENIKKLRFIHEDKLGSAKRFLLAGGNPFVLSTEKLLRISEMIHENFPECEYISAFSRADDVTRKNIDELKILHDSGYDRLCLGIESGSDEVLKRMFRGYKAEDCFNFVQKIQKLKRKISITTDMII